MMRFLLTLVFIASGVLVGCATPPTDKELRNADYGPSPTDYERTVKDFMATQLKDPTSAVYEFHGLPSQMWAKELFGPAMYGWGICAWINAKNSFGGYTGRQKNFFLIRNDRVILFRNDIAAEQSCKFM